MPKTFLQLCIAIMIQFVARLTVSRCHLRWWNCVANCINFLAVFWHPITLHILMLMLMLKVFSQSTVSQSLITFWVAMLMLGVNPICNKIITTSKNVSQIVNHTTNWSYSYAKCWDHLQDWDWHQIGQYDQTPANSQSINPIYHKIITSSKNGLQIVNLTTNWIIICIPDVETIFSIGIGTRFGYIMGHQQTVSQSIQFPTRISLFQRMSWRLLVLLQTGSLWVFLTVRQSLASALV